MTAKRGKRRIAPKYGPLTVEGGDYSVRLNPPIQAFADLMSGNLDRIVPALGALVQEHPFVDEDGESPLPFGQWTFDEVQPFVEAYGALMNALPPG